MFEKITPEQAGIRSQYVSEFLTFCEKRGLAMHSVLMMRGTGLFLEAYWKPFDRDFCHRMYSQTKSYVAVAIGLLEEEGKLCLDDPISRYFPEKIHRELPTYLKEQTIREMLMMCTSCLTKDWFAANIADRTEQYLNESIVYRPAGTGWFYDSPGSQVLCVLAERLAGMPLMDYLRQKIFSKLGTFQSATMLKTANGDSWGDSSLLCTTRDMVSFARFLMNYGVWNGERLMNEAYLRAATTKQTSNQNVGFVLCKNRGYGYQIWVGEQNSFFFNGMGGQFTVCVPEKDFIFACTGDNQGYENYTEVIHSKLFDGIVDHLGQTALPEDPEASDALDRQTDALTLCVADGATDSPTAERYHGKEFVVTGENRAGWTRFSLHFRKGAPCELRYTNAQGDKTLYFGMGENVFGKFPQYGYSQEFGGQRTQDGSCYDCAVSGAWADEHQLLLRCQIIDRYFGNMTAVISFKDNHAVVNLISYAEDFLREYNGTVVGTLRPQNGEIR